jgi:uncharacterized protein YecE (DUF72 family)
MAEARIGISGWRYPPWRGTFYPTGLSQRSELAYAAERMTAIEINGTFYSLQRPSSFRAWRDATPDGFVFAVKGGRFITHLKRLRDVDTALANFFASGVLALGDKLGPLLWQLPPTLAFDSGLLVDFFGRLPRTTVAAAELARSHDDRVPEDRAMTEAVDDRQLRHALEVRHQSFAAEGVVELLRDNDIALVVADTAGKWPALDAVTSDFCYARLHGSRELYASGYTDTELDTWAQRLVARLEAGIDVFAFFDNDIKVRAPFDAIGLIDRLEIWRPRSSAPG